MNNYKPLEIRSLRFEGVSFSHEGTVGIFENVDFDFPMNNFVWVKSEAGYGRSTLLQILAALKMPHSGRYLINEEEINEMSFEEFLPYRMSIGYGFDLGGVIHNKTLLENLTLPLLYHKVCSQAEAEKRAWEYMNWLGIDKHKNLRPSSVSGGVRKLTCLIRSLIMHPQVLIMDDPTVGLDPETKSGFMALIQQLRGKGHLKHVFMSSFDEQWMSQVEAKTIYIESKQLWVTEPQSGKKAVGL
ncbi:MAG: ATP-binding cassette domain-containing protein [Pseudobdellovibrionaceae bacterium]